jgi:uncharacterized LabA/DUF88 family protein
MSLLYVPNTTDIKYLYIDGAYLDRIIGNFSKEFFGGDPIPIDYAKIRSTIGAKRVFYYQGIPLKMDSESEEDYELRIGNQIERLGEISILDGYFVREGVVRCEGKRKRQKKVDILIAVDMLTHSIRGTMDRAILLSGDFDFQPLVDALVQTGMITMIYCDKRSASEDLISSADSCTCISIVVLHGWTTDKFQIDNPLPRCVSTPVRHQFESMLLKSGKNTYGDIVRLFRDDDKYCISFPDILNRSSDHQIYLWHQDLVFLEKYCTSEGYKILWD